MKSIIILNLHQVLIADQRKVWCMTCVVQMQEMRNMSYLVKKPEGKRLLGENRYGWEDNIEMNIQEDGHECVDWNQYWFKVELMAGSCVSSGSAKCMKFLDKLSNC